MMRLFNRIKKQHIIFTLILFLAVFLRTWNLANVPPSASLDEASIGYNAYSVLKTGGDEFGQFPLISQRGYDDYRRSTYLFLVIPSVATFGLNDVAVRLPAVIMSILTVISSYFIIKLLFAKKSKFSQTAPFLVMFLLAISPWHIYISRLGHESNACLSFLVFAILFFLLGERKKKFYLLLISFILFTLSMISYYSGQAFVPVFLLVLLIVFRKSIFGVIFSKKTNIVLFVAAIILVIPVFINIFSPNSLIRFQGTSTFKPEAHSDLYQQMVKLRNEAVKQKNIIGEIIYNRRIYPLRVFIDGYFSHFNTRWLFTNSSNNEPFKAPNLGLLYPWELPFILIGLIYLFLSKEIDAKFKILVFTWFFLSPVPPAIATQAPHAMRAYNFLPTWQIFTSVGLLSSFYCLKKSFRIFGKLLILVFVLFSLWSLYSNYFVIFPKQQSNAYQFAMKNAINYVYKNQNSYNKIIISNQNNLFQSYMFFLFYTKYNPKVYQEKGGTISGGFAETHKIDNIYFRPIDWEKDRNLSNVLLVGNKKDFPPGVGTAFKSYYLNGEEAIDVVRL